MDTTKVEPIFCLRSAKLTGETLTGKDWGTVLNLWDKVEDEGKMEFVSSRSILAGVLMFLCSGRNAIAALLKRHAYRSLTMQLPHRHNIHIFVDCRSPQMSIHNEETLQGAMPTPNDADLIRLI